MENTALLDALRLAAIEGADVALDGFRTDLTVETKSGRFDRVTRIDRAVQRRVAESLSDAAPDVPFVGEEETARKDVPDDGLAWVVDPIDGTNNYVAGGVVWAVAVAATWNGEPVAGVTHLPVVDETYCVGIPADLDGDGGPADLDGDGGPDEHVDGDGARWITADDREETDSIARRNGKRIHVSDVDDPSSFTVNPIFGFSDRHRRHHRRALETIFEAFGDYRRVGCAQAALASVASGELEGSVSTVELNAWDTVGGVRLIRAAGGRVTDVHGDRWTPGSTGLIATNGTAHDHVVDAFAVGPSGD